MRPDPSRIRQNGIIDEEGFSTRRKNIVLVLFLILIDKIALNIVVPLMPFQLATLGADATTLGLLTSSFALMQLLGGPVCKFYI